MRTGWLTPAQNGFRITVRLTPRAARDGIDGTMSLPDGRAAIAARVRAVPEKGKANQALIKLIAKAARLPASSVGMISGETSRIKTLQINGDSGALKAAVAESEKA